jgi:hypothetical protein
MEARPHHRRREGGQFRLDGRAEGVGEPPRGLHHHVDQVAPAVEPQLRPLFVQVGDRLRHLRAGVLPDTGTVVEHAVDGRLAQPGLLGDLADLVAVRHGSGSRSPGEQTHVARDTPSSAALCVCSRTSVMVF